MTAVLPGTIPGLLRLCSPVVREDGRAGGVTGFLDGWPLVGWSTGACSSTPPGRVSLRLDDPTGRAHAAWWLAKQNEDDVDVAIVDHLLGGAMPADGFDVTRHRWLAFWSSGAPATDTQIDALRRIVLHVAEVTP